MQILKAMLLASVLAVGAGSLAGCDDMTDCPSAVAEGGSCTAAGLSCFTGPSRCTCTGGKWVCDAADMRVPDLAPPRDLSPGTD